MNKLTHETLRRKIGESRVGRAPIRDVNYVIDMFARFLNAELRSTLRWPVVVNVTKHELIKLGAAMDQADEGGIYAVLDASSNFGGAMIFNPAFVFRWVDALTGCDGSIDDPEESRDFTSIDGVLTMELVTSILDSFERAFAPDGAEKRRSVAFSRYVTERAAIIDVEDTMDVLNIKFSVRIGSEDTGRAFSFFVPLGVLDVYKAAEKKAKPDKLDELKNETLWASTMLAAANEATFRLVAVLHEKTMSVGDVRDLKVGSIIQLPHVGSMPLELRMDTPKGVAGEAGIGDGMLGAIDGQRAIRMLEPPRQEFVEHLKHFSTDDEIETDLAAVANDLHLSY